MYKEILEQQLDLLTGKQDEAIQENAPIETVLAVAAEIRQTAETLARCEYNTMKRGMKS